MTCADRHSTVVKDMITAVSLPDTSAPHPALETTTPIELDYPARVVGAFLRKAYGMRAPQTRDSLFANDKYFDDYNEGIQLYNLLRQLDCPRLLEETYYEVAYAAKREGKSAELLLLASNNADVDLAVKTMERVEDEELDALYTSADDMNQFLVKLRPSWADFLRARVFQTTQDGRQQLRPRTEHRWYLLASDFKYDVGVAEGRYAPRARGGLFVSRAFFTHDKTPTDVAPIELCRRRGCCSSGPCQHHQCNLGCAAAANRSSGQHGGRHHYRQQCNTDSGRRLVWQRTTKHQCVRQLPAVHLGACTAIRCL